MFGGTLAGLRLVERGACTSIYQAAALGLTDRVRAELAARPGPEPERITTAFWAACGRGHQDIAVLLRAAGADSNWTGWNNQNPLDAALAADRTELASWLQANGGHPAAEPPSAEHTP